MALPKGIISDFEKITNYGLTAYIEEFVDFVRVGRFQILDYYIGRVSTPNMSAFSSLRGLLDESIKLVGVIDGNRNRMREGRYWELIEVLEEMETSLETIDNTSKWVRSAISKGNFNSQIEVERVLRQFQTLESVASETGSTNPDQDWINIALRNDLPEEGYTNAGGNTLGVLGSNRLSIQIRSVVDNISGKNIYGIDFNRKITFIDDDLETLGYDATMKQSVNILAALRRGDTPEFPEEGIQGSLVTGANRQTIAYPIILRQFYNTFEKDDTLKSLRVTNIEAIQDALHISFEIETRLSEIIQEVGQI